MKELLKLLSFALDQRLNLNINRSNLLIFVFILIGLYFISILTFKRNVKQDFEIMNKKRNNIILSPFGEILAFIRMNSIHYDRLSTLEKYRPFFFDLHYSMPNYSPTINLTADGWTSGNNPYKVVAQTMNILLQNYSMIKGILYFHFDAWINPFKYDGMNFNNIWFPGKFSAYLCGTNTTGSTWIYWNDDAHNIVKSAKRNLLNKYPKRFITIENVLCGGWSDIYYIPRRFFEDFIDLSDEFHKGGSFHEIAIPSMIDIIDVTFRLTPFHTVITRLKDCWGHCCAYGASPMDIQRNRCGHKMDLRKDLIKNTLIHLLDSQRIYLNKSLFNK